MRLIKNTLCTLAALMMIAGAVVAQDKSIEPTVAFDVADGGIKLTASRSWNKVKPRSNMLEAEFQIPKVDGDERDGRLTIMGAGGSVKANIDRWIGQFSTSDGGPVTGVEPKTITVAGQKVHLVDISGTFADSMGGPFGPKTKRANYRMLGTIIETETKGKYFIKLYGPKATIDANADHFHALVKSMRMPASDTTFTVADGNIQFRATGKWAKVKPRSSMLEAEFKFQKWLVTRRMDV